MTLKISDRDINNPVKKIPEDIRLEFPILDQEVNGKPLIYFDNAATSQKPRQVIEAISNYYTGYNSNIHRGIHTLAEKATETFELTRAEVQSFINAGTREEIIFTYGTTDGINLIAQSFGSEFLKAGDEVVISTMEHHSNIVPWQMICDRMNARLRVIPISDEGEIILDEYEKILNPKTRLVSLVHVSNSLGTINPVKEMIRMAHDAGALIHLDGAQSAAHLPIDVQDLDCDFFTFSSHKVFGPTGAGVLYGKQDLLEKMPPYRGGGEMISEVTFEKTTYNKLPFKFEAGTPNIADIIGFRTALQYIKSLPRKDILEYENSLTAYAHKQLFDIEGLRFIGTAKNKAGIVSFILDRIHPFDAGMMLDAAGIAVRTGHHCTQPLMRRFGIEGTIRASFSIYNTYEEIDVLADRLKKITKIKK